MDRFIPSDESYSIKDELVDPVRVCVPEVPRIADWSLPNLTSTPYPAPSQTRLTPSVQAEKRRHDNESVEAGGSERQNKNKRHFK
jgi:hypothetical protein